MEPRPERARANGEMLGRPAPSVIRTHSGCRASANRDRGSCAPRAGASTLTGLPGRSHPAAAAHWSTCEAQARGRRTSSRCVPATRTAANGRRRIARHTVDVGDAEETRRAQPRRCRRLAMDLQRIRQRRWKPRHARLWMGRFGTDRLSDGDVLIGISCARAGLTRP